MQRLPATPENIQLALRTLEEGGVVAHATETCYGLACDLTNPAAVKKLFLIKNRPPEQPVSALFSSVEEAKKYVQWNEKAASLAEKFLPGPLTIILPLEKNPPHKIYAVPSGGTTVGIRVSPHPVADALVRGFGKPLSTTSANAHGEGNPYTADVIIHSFADASAVPDLVLDSGDLPMNPPSTIINLATGEGGIVRTGNVKV